MNAKRNTAIFHDEHDDIVIIIQKKKENKSKRTKQICIRNDKKG